MSILNDVKHKIGPSGDYDYYDLDIMDAINSAFGTLTQLGVGPAAGYRIEGDTEEWTDYATDITVLNLVKDYVYKKVRLIFDPPNGSILTEFKDQIKELEFRLSVQVDPGQEV